MFRLHHLTDTHHPRPDSHLRRYVQALVARALGPLPDALLHTGDLVDGTLPIDAPDAPAILRAQHLACHDLLSSPGLPIHAIAHTHDRRGDPRPHWGATFCEVWRQPLARVVPCPENLDLILLSGSVTLPPFAPEPARPAPDWGFDLFDLHVLAALENLVATQARPGSYRVLASHLPIVVPPDFPRPGDRYTHVPISAEGLGRILPVLHRLGIRHVLGGHLHQPYTLRHQDIEFTVGASLLDPRPGYGEITWTDGRLRYEHRTLPPH